MITKIKKVKLIVETNTGEEVILVDSEYNNAEVSFETGLEEPKFRETSNGIAIGIFKKIPTKTYHILIRDMVEGD